MFLCCIVLQVSKVQIKKCSHVQLTVLFSSELDCQRRGPPKTHHSKHTSKDVYLCCCRHPGSLVLRRWWWETGSQWSDSFCTCDICRERRNEERYLFLLLSCCCKRASGFLRCLEVLSFSQLTPRDSTSVPPHNPTAVSQASEKCKHYEVASGGSHLLRDAIVSPTGLQWVGVQQ